MDYLQAFPSQMRIKGRLWQTNVFQDGSHETHLVFKVVGFKGMFELRRFSHLLSPFLIWESEAAPTPRSLFCSSGWMVSLYKTLGACFLAVSKRSQQWMIGTVPWLNFIIIFFWMYVDKYETAENFKHHLVVNLRIFPVSFTGATIGVWVAIQCLSKDWDPWVCVPALIGLWQN